MKKNYRKSVLAFICVLAMAFSLLSVPAFASDYDAIYVNGDKRVLTAEGELSAILRLPVDVPGRIHILTSGVNVALAIYNEATFELCGVYSTENGLMDVPFDAYPGTYLLGFSGWGEVAVLVADENLTAQLYGYSAAPAEEPAEEVTERPAEDVSEVPTEDSAEESPEVPADGTVEMPAEDSAEGLVKEQSEAPAEEYAETLAEEQSASASEISAEEQPSAQAEEPTEADPEKPAEESVGEVLEEPAIEEASQGEVGVSSEELTEEVALVEEPAEEPVFPEGGPDPSVPLTYTFTDGAPVSVLSILKAAGSPANMIIEITRDTDGWFTSHGTTDGDWLLTAHAYFDSIEVSVRAGYFNPADGSVKDAVYTLILSYPDPAPVEAPAAAETVTPEEPEAPAEELTDEVAPAEEPVEEPVEEPAEDAAEEPSQKEDVSSEELTDEVIPAASEPEISKEELLIANSQYPIHYSFTGGSTISVLSILQEAGSPANMIQNVARDSDGWFFSTGSSDGDWLFTPYAYFDSMEVSVKAAYFDPSDGSITDTVYTLVLSYPDPAAEEASSSDASALPPESSSPVREVTIAMERFKGNEIRLYAENLDSEENLLCQWQYSLDNETWLDVDGANSPEYTFTLNSSNSSSYWRLIVSEK